MTIKHVCQVGSKSDQDSIAHRYSIRHYHNAVYIGPILDDYAVKARV